MFEVKGTIHGFPHEVQWSEGRLIGDEFVVDLAKIIADSLEGEAVGISLQHTFTNHLSFPISALAILREHVFDKGSSIVSGDVPILDSVPTGAVV